MTHNEFLGELRLKNKYYKNNLFVVLSTYKSLSSYVQVRDEFGECSMAANSLLRGFRPTIASAINKTEYWINKMKAIHGDRFDYSQVEYVDVETPVKIICNVHGAFYKTPKVHCRTNGCVKCSHESLGKDRRISTISFIEESKEVHKNRYTYNKVDYKGKAHKVCITCPEHGDFWQDPYSHKKGSICPKCYNNKAKSVWSTQRGKGKSATLYLVKLSNSVESFVKIGITLNSINRRFEHKVFKNYAIDVLFKETTTNRSLIWDLELLIKEKFETFRHKPSAVFSGASTECFSIACAENILTELNGIFFSMYDNSTVNSAEQCQDINFLKRI